MAHFTRWLGNFYYLSDNGSSCIFIFVLLSRPLTILSLDDEQARRLGAPVNLLRYLVIFVCAAITALVVSKIGVIGFIGFAVQVWLILPKYDIYYFAS